MRLWSSDASDLGRKRPVIRKSFNYVVAGWEVPDQPLLHGQTLLLLAGRLADRPEKLLRLYRRNQCGGYESGQTTSRGLVIRQQGGRESNDDSPSVYCGAYFDYE